MSPSQLVGLCREKRISNTRTYVSNRDHACNCGIDWESVDAIDRYKNRCERIIK